MRSIPVSRACVHANYAHRHNRSRAGPLNEHWGRIATLAGTPVDSRVCFVRRVRCSERDVLRVRQRSWALRAPSPRDSHDGMRRAPSIGRVRRRGRAARRMLLPAPALPTSGLRHGSGSKRSPRAGGGGHAAWPPRTTSSSTCAAASSLCMCRSSPQARRGESSVRPRDGAGVVGGIARVRSSDADGARRGWRFC